MPLFQAVLDPSYEAMLGWEPFFRSLRDREPATIRDPYAP